MKQKADKNLTITDTGLSHRVHQIELALLHPNTGEASLGEGRGEVAEAL